MNKLHNNIALRALNQTKMLNPITYLCIRSFFENISNKSSKSGLFEEILKRKLTVRKHWTVKKNKLFKDLIDGEFNYRDILSLSAFGVISESYLMREFVKQDCFTNHPNVYSYMLPIDEDSNRNFDYYYNGYKNRNVEIEKVLAMNKNHIALILDLTKFYPSADKEKVKKKFLEKISDLDNEINDLSKNIINSLFNQCKSGIPIGLNINHLLAQVYLEDFDNNMVEKYTNRYFRYVDDIVIVCSQDEEKDVISYVKSKLPSELEINESKTDRLTYDEWKIINSPYDEKGNLNAMMNFITAFISLHPTKIVELEKQLKEKKYNIPIGRLKKQSKSENFMNYIKYVISRDSYWTTFEIYRTQVEYIVTQLATLKDNYLEMFNSLCQLQFTNDNSATNRSNTQQLKLILNRLMYLCTIDELGELLIQIPLTEKLSDTREIILALNTKDLTNTIKFGGKVLQTVSELWNENNLNKVMFTKKDLIEFVSLDNVIDSVIILYLYQVIDFRKEDIVDLLDDEINKEYFLVITDENYIPKLVDNLYIMEIYGLLKNISLEEKYELLVTRYDNDENLQLAGLDLEVDYL